MTFAFTLQADYTRRKSICAKQLLMGLDPVTHEAVTQSVQL
jgi:hypothetical protein